MYFVLYLLIWEENESIKLKKKFLNLEEVGQEIITITIKKNVEKNEWKDIMKKLTTDKFIEKSKKIHGNKYNYSKVNYINSHKKIEIICNKKHTFYQTPNDHLTGHGCSVCGYKNVSKKNRKYNTNRCIKKFLKIHKNKYDYSKFIYLNWNVKSKINCKKHGIFLQSPHKHMEGDGCVKCWYELLSKTKCKNTNYFIKLSKQIRHIVATILKARQ